MTESEILLPSGMPRSSTNMPVFRIVLEDVHQYDIYASREFDLAMDSTFPIGRASKNATKKELMPAAYNAYIDSPVISREHAVLSANTSSGTPQVYISDKNSMHGTMVNGQPLTPNTPKQLSAGDVIQLGLDVNRNEGTYSNGDITLPEFLIANFYVPAEYFVARKYTFDYRLTQPFSRGFAVPDPESEEEELEPHGRRGSQSNPLILDDSEAGSVQSDDDLRDVTVVEEAAVFIDEPTAATGAPFVDEKDPAAVMRAAMIKQAESNLEEDECSVEYSSQSEDEASSEADIDIDSEAASVGSSEPEYNSSDREVPDTDEEAVDDVAYKKWSTDNLPTVQPRDLFNMDLTNGQAPELPSLGVFSSGHLNTTPFHGSMMPPMPSSLSASKQAPWEKPKFTSFGQQSDSQSWYSDEMPGLPQSYLGTNFGDRPSIFSPAPPPPGLESSRTQKNEIAWGGAMSSAPPADGMQTPPPLPASDISTNSPLLQPNRRTKVSIEEIVEEQPLTPTSVGGLKRKADLLEEEEEFVTEPVVVSEGVIDAAAQTATSIAQRPKKQPRSVLSKVLNKAAYPLLGAAGAVASFTLLSTLPDTFFGA
ncbi:hypothetical protein N0V83_003287 [Neocucurbitaria cava]|uniref:FHA domain-containing protein n=1 Tax=Neocucurbitaria cava TaxID=798079 RepID=A0A9W8YCX1_9PLEO|nr:hypothetical protein N0V83_003287 [Neocucurbitaria cava]